MDNARFDALARRVFARVRSRRGVLAILASSGVGLLVGDATRTAAARPKRARRRDARAQDIDAAIKLPPGKRFAGCRFVSQTCGTVSIRRGKKVQKKVLRCCANSSCYRTGPSGNLIPNGKTHLGRCYCNSPCYADPDGDGICTLIPPPPCVALNGACDAGHACCDPGAGAGSGGGAVCIGDICGGYSFCPPASVACAAVDPQKGAARCDAVPDGAPQCCKLETMGCANDCQCCGALHCHNGSCQPAGCLEYGAVCTPSEVCCDAVPCTGPGDGGPSRCRYP